MATRKKGLGRGLDALLGADNGALDTVGRQKDDSPSQLPIGALRAGRYQPRTRMDEGALNDLAESIRAQGIMQPILVRPLEDEPGQYE
ncbi:MAG: ParB N-terminal domain-containing protein, partial [Castellaniella sp.]